MTPLPSSPWLQLLLTRPFHRANLAAERRSNNNDDPLNKVPQFLDTKVRFPAKQVTLRELTYCTPPTFLMTLAPAYHPMGQPFFFGYCTSDLAPSSPLY